MYVFLWFVIHLFFFRHYYQDIDKVHINWLFISTRENFYQDNFTFTWIQFLVIFPFLFIWFNGSLSTLKCIKIMWYTLWSLWSLHLSPAKHLRDFELIKRCSLPQISNHQVGEYPWKGVPFLCRGFRDL